MSLSAHETPNTPAHAFLRQVAAATRKLRMRAKGWSDDRQTIKVLQRHLRPDSICVDVGAHKGQDSQAHPAGRSEGVALCI
jgi:hypothetical protein